MLFYLFALICFAFCGLGTRWMRLWAMRRTLWDTPSARSSHIRPTLRGGGLPWVLLAFLLLGALSQQQWIPLRDTFLLIGGGVGIALLGWLDDLNQISAKKRLLGQALICAAVIYWNQGYPLLDIGGMTIFLGIGGAILAWFLLLWMINLYNFMDGIDGIAVMQAVSVCSILWGFTHQPLYLGMAALGGGFLIYNWSPACIFMGDVTSGFLGFFFGFIVLYPLPSLSTMPTMSLWSSLILLQGFVVDTTLTLWTHCLHRQNLLIAHSDHAYQRLARQIASRATSTFAPDTARQMAHRAVSLGLLGINVLWLMPLAWCALAYPAYAVGFWLISWLPLVALWSYARKVTN